MLATELIISGGGDGGRGGVAVALILDGHGFIQAQRAADHATGFDRLTVGLGGAVSHGLTFAGRSAACDISIIIRGLEQWLTIVEPDDPRVDIDAADFSLAGNAATCQ